MVVLDDNEIVVITLNRRMAGGCQCGLASIGDTCKTLAEGGAKRSSFLLIKKTNKVLFAEAGKDFTDFLMSLLALPVGSVIRLLTKQKMVGCIGKLYESVENLSGTYILPGSDKNLLLNPGMVTYMVTDDLVVTPITICIISSFIPLDKFNLKDNGVLEEKVVEVGKEEGLALLKASLQSNTALSDVFLGKLVGEAGKYFIDFLTSILSFPIGSVTRLLTRENMVGCLGKLYESVENLSKIYTQRGHDKNFLLNPSMPSIPSCPNPHLLGQNNDSTSTKKYFSCYSTQSSSYGSHGGYIHPYVTEVKGTPCPYCKTQMNKELAYVFPNNTTKVVSNEEGGFVKGVVTYMVTDDLVVTPMSTVEAITLLSEFNVKDTGVLESKVVRVGFKEGLDLFVN
ncbi:uncharacterized protein LOC143891861 [Tasmannia lanceolata]|uniref:uncharacterized protein LOC143891861 n=1 Tax=Tasmannia lanceolata TaxID=3420 RepID=UPI0040647DA5